MSELFDSLLSMANVQALIDGGVRESQTLEYKAAAGQFSDKAKQEIPKDVSAMANSGGGTIIYGVEAHPEDKTRPVAIQGIHTTNIETFDRVVNSRVKPPVKWVKRVLPTAEAAQVLIVDVIPSDDPPHQSLADHRYYHRSGTESRPMEHDLVALYFGRRLGPMLSLRVHSLSACTVFDQGTPPFSHSARLRFFIANTGRRVARFLLVVLKFQPATICRISNILGEVTILDDLYPGIQVRQYADNMGVIHPGNARRIVEFDFQISREFIEQHPTDPFVRWTIYADDMNAQNGEMSIRDIGWA